MINEITIIASQCQGTGRITFDDVQVALAFVRMLAQNVTPESFVAFIHAYVPDSDAAENAKRLAEACMGSPS